MAEETIFSGEEEARKRRRREYQALALAAALLVVGLVGRLWYTQQTNLVASLPLSQATELQSLESAEFLDREVRTISCGDASLQVEVVTSSASIEQGLSGRREIGSDGMLFILPLRQQPSFWMKEMQFDLDMVWIDRSIILAIATDVPAPDPLTPLSELPLFKPPGLVTAVLELPAGDAARLGITAGSRCITTQ